MTMTDGYRPVLEVRNLTTVIDMQGGPVPVVESVSFALERGKTLGLVGESGCGKSITALSILRLLPPAGKTTNGTIHFQGKDILALPEREMRMIRGAG
ncbi:MAG: ATP-binding cassette domain-containing protein, partial [Bacteroidota bacterium]|nr:ATP-binding cassette domain-containing protein [Bacteroidota bacterium]